MAMSTKTFLDPRPVAVLDTECYKDYWSIGFENVETGKRVIYELHSDSQLNRAGIIKIFKNFRVVSFNGNHYDMPMIALAMKPGVTNQQLKDANDAIFKGVKSWEFYDKYGVKLPDFLDHIDIFEVAPGVRISLKKYGARLNMKRLQELPIDPAEAVGVSRRPLMRSYLGNDLATTRALWNVLQEEVTMRAELSVEHGVDLRSKSDAQIAETLIKLAAEKKTGKKIQTPKKLGLVKAHSFYFDVPKFIEYETPLLQSMLTTIRETRFNVDADGVTLLPESIKRLKLRIGFTDYKMGLGGLHSKEKRRSFVADEDTAIIDRDVRAYYPWLMLGCGYYPKAVGSVFMPIFRSFVVMRDGYKAKSEKLKKLGQDGESLKYKKRSDGLKIVNNGAFGKGGSPYSILWEPKMMIATTLTGQLSIFMLIERLELDRFSVISANTDGIITLVPRNRRTRFEAIIFDWECDTSLNTEETEYAGVYSKSVNSYIALPHDHATNPKAKIKLKGLFAPAGVQNKHDPTFDVCSEAVVAYLTKGEDIEDFIRGCDDFTKFIGVRQVGKSGGEKDGEYLGKLVRWYYAEGERGHINEVLSKARVAGTTGARPCMDLPEEFPDDLDFEKYVREAYARLDDIGLNVRNPALAGRTGFVIASLPKQKTAHVVDLLTRQSLCQRGEKEVRQAWIEYEAVPDDLRICKKCQAERGHEEDDEDD